MLLIQTLPPVLVMRKLPTVPVMLLMMTSPSARILMLPPDMLSVSMVRFATAVPAASCSIVRLLGVAAGLVLRTSVIVPTSVFMLRSAPAVAIS